MKTSKNHIDLNDIKKENVFHVPENYFKELPSIIQFKTSAKEKKASKLSWLLTPVSLKYALPAVLLVVGLFLFIKPKATTEIDISSISEEEILTYLSVYDENIVEVYSSVSEEDIDLNLNEFLEVDHLTKELYYNSEADQFINSIELNDDIDPELIELL